MVGIDLVEISRFEKFINRFGDKGLKRFLCDAEIALISSPKSAAGFWAVKEAFSKALGTGIGKECSFHDMRLYKTHKGAPKLSLSKALIARFEIEDVALSITHDGAYAIAVVTIVTSSPADEIQQF